MLYRNGRAISFFPQQALLGIGLLLVTSISRMGLEIIMLAMATTNVVNSPAGLDDEVALILSNGRCALRAVKSVALQ